MSCLCLLTVRPLHAQRNAGIFYSTLFAKERPLKWATHFGDGAVRCFLRDVNGDGKDDAVAVYANGGKSGAVEVALSDGHTFLTPVHALTFRGQWTFIQPLMGDLDGDGKADLLFRDMTTGDAYVALSGDIAFRSAVRWKLPQEEAPGRQAFLADINGDRKADLLVYQGAGKWVTALSTGHGFGIPYPLASGFGADEETRIVGDVNGDGKADLITGDFSSGTWKVALSDGKQCSGEAVWATGLTGSKIFGDKQDSRPPVCMMYDIDKDGRDDLICWDKNGACSWSAAYSTGKGFGPPQTWVANFLHGEHKNNIPDAGFGMPGSPDGKKAAVMIVSGGKWLGLEYPGRGKTADPALIDTWEAWGNDYIPDGGTYDSGDPAVNDRQIRQIHDAGFTYVTLDITNGSNAWVDNRARQFMERLRYWNRHLKPGDHKMYANISLGITRGIEGEDAFFNRLNQECKRAWEEFYLPFKDLYYLLKGKPLVIHMITTGWKYVKDIDTWKGDRAYIDKITCRWMDGTQSGASGEKSNCYGWVIPEKYGNVADPEMMPVMPGFWNGLTFVGREDGDFYRSQWMRVIQYAPRSVWVNSFNETWEHTAVEPSHHVIDRFVANPLFTKPWSDHYGNRMDDFYWIMTRQYNRLFMDNVLLQGTYFQEYGDSTIFRATATGFIKQTAWPVKAPVLLLPEGFRKTFKGKIVDPQR
ncbi:FG-GAP-like repeat-containing protein [Compostibacter hankyongensis]